MLKIDYSQDSINLKIDRSNILESSFVEVGRVELGGADLSARRISIKFRREPGVDGGALSRDFFASLSHAIFDQASLFEKIGTHDKFFNVVAMADNQITESVLEKYRFAGKLMGMALLNEGLLNETVSTVLLRQLLDRPFDWRDIRETDEAQYKTYQRCIHYYELVGYKFFVY